MKTNSKLNTIRKDNKLLSEKIDLNNQKTAELLTTIRNYHRSINAYLLSQKSKHLQLKQSILNESLYDEYIQLNNNYINNYSQYLKLHNMLDVSIKDQKINRDNKYRSVRRSWWCRRNYRKGYGRCHRRSGNRRRHRSQSR